MLLHRAHQTDYARYQASGYQSYHWPWAFCPAQPCPSFILPHPIPSSSTVLSQLPSLPRLPSLTFIMSSIRSPSFYHLLSCLFVFSICLLLPSSTRFNRSIRQIRNWCGFHYHTILRTCHIPAKFDSRRVMEQCTIHRTPLYSAALYSIVQDSTSLC
jgi:hypothetical protein